MADTGNVDVVVGAVVVDGTVVVDGGAVVVVESAAVVVAAIDVAGAVVATGEAVGGSGVATGAVVSAGSVVHPVKTTTVNAAVAAKRNMLRPFTPHLGSGDGAPPSGIPPTSSETHTLTARGN